MKFYNKDLKKLVTLLESGNTHSFLMHGPNQGFIKTAYQYIAKKLKLNITEYDFKEINASRLEMLANNMNFFAEKELICIRNVSGMINKDVKEFLSSKSLQNIICFMGSDSMPPSGYRKFFEDQKHLVSLGAYFEDEANIARIIIQQLAKHGKKIDEDGLHYLKSNLKGDHQIIKSELEKILCYTFDSSVVTKTHIEECLSKDLMASGDNLCIYFAKKDYARLNKEMKKLKEQSINEVLMIRALIRYYTNIFIVTSKIEDNANIDIAIKSLRPPIFFKNIPDFKQIIRKYNSNEALMNLGKLQQAEKDYKTNPKSFDLFRYT